MLLALIIVVGTALRLTSLLWGKDFFFGAADSASFYEIADNIYKGRGPVVDFVYSFLFSHKDLTHPDDWWEPLFPYTIAAFFMIFGQSLFTAKFTSFVFGVLTIPLVFYVGRRIFDDKVGLLASLFIAINPYHIFYSGFILKEVLYSFIFLATVFMFYSAYRTDKTLYWIFSGLLIGLAYLTRYNAALLLLIPFVILFISKKLEYARTRNFIISLVVISIVLLPWALYTYDYFGTPLYTNQRSMIFYYSPTRLMWDPNTPSLEEFFTSVKVPEKYAELNLDVFKTLFITKIAMPLYNLTTQSPLIFTPILFTFFILSLLRQKDEFAKIIQLVSLMTVIFFMLGGLGVFPTEKYILPLIVVSMPLIGKLTLEMTKGFAYNRLITVIIAVSFIFSIASLTNLMLSWKFSGSIGVFSGENSDWISRLQNYEKVGTWMKGNTRSDDAVMSNYPWELHYFSDRRAVITPRISNLNGQVR